MSTRAWATFVAVSVIWGIPYLFIKVAVDEGIPPVFLAWVRVVLGGAVLLGLAWRSGALTPLRGRLSWVVVFAGLEIVVPFPLITAGEQRVDSLLAAIIIAAAPLFVALLALVSMPPARRRAEPRRPPPPSPRLSAAPRRTSSRSPEGRSRRRSVPLVATERRNRYATTKARGVPEHSM